MSELTMQPIGSFTIRRVRLCRSGMNTEIDPLSINLYRSLPLLFPWRHTLEARGIICSLFGVVLILRGCGNAKIVALIVQGVSVFMVSLSLIAVLQSQNLAMHFYVSWDAVNMATPDGIKSLCEFRPLRAPFPLIQPVEFSRVNTSNLSLRKWDSAIGWFRGLGNLFLQAHVVPPQKALQLNPILT